MFLPRYQSYGKTTARSVEHYNDDRVLLCFVRNEETYTFQKVKTEKSSIKNRTMMFRVQWSKTCGPQPNCEQHSKRSVDLWATRLFQLWAETNFALVMSYPQGCIGVGTRGNRVPIPFSRFALK